MSKQNFKSYMGYDSMDDAREAVKNRFERSNQKKIYNGIKSELFIPSPDIEGLCIFDMGIPGFPT